MSDSDDAAELLAMLKWPHYWCVMFVKSGNKRRCVVTIGNGVLYANCTQRARESLAELIRRCKAELPAET